MRYHLSYLFLAVAAISSAIAQLLSNLPECAQIAALSTIGSTGCDLGDYVCVCKDSDFATSFATIIQDKCSPAEVQTVRVFAEDLCAGVGVSITVPNITTTPTTAEASPTAGPASATPTGGVESASAVIRTGHISDILLLSVVGIAVSWLGWL